jgi:hypothetical protein
MTRPSVAASTLLAVAAVVLATTPGVASAASVDGRANAADAAASGGRAAAGAVRRCVPAAARVAAGRSLRLALDCRVVTRTGRRRLVAGGRRGVAGRAIVRAPRHGRLSAFAPRAGRVRYRPRPGFSGRDRIVFAVRLRDGRRFRGAIRIAVGPRSGSRPTPRPAPTLPSAPTAPAPGDGLPAILPPAPASVAFGARNWSPTPADSCPRSLHERYSVIGPDGKAYPTWHPPTVVDPATGQPCSFGHEHGRDPAGSDIGSWVAAHFAGVGKEAFAGIPFGLATEALDEWAQANPGTATRQEDHVGYKVDYQDDVPLIAADGASLGVECDYLVRVHQGSHSPDALSNNVHELLYAVRCSDGTELISNTVGRFGDPGEYARSCEPSVLVPATDNGYPDGAGSRLIPDRACMETSFLVPSGRTTSAWAAYEKWSSEGTLTAAGGGPPLASFNPAFGVFNPSRYGDPAATGKMARTLDLCWEVEPNSDRARGVECDEATGFGAIATPYGFDDDRSPYDGTYRDFYVDETALANADGPTRWWTDPYGGNGSPEPFPGALCQLVGAVDTTGRPDLQTRVFGRNRTFEAPGVHAPN